MTDLLDRLTTALQDRYAIERELGAGGMATVYLAEDLKLHRKVAVKVLRPELAATLGPERFLREIEIAANLHHPHILALHDSGESDGFLYYVMPFVEGESLRDRLDREKQLPIEDAVQIAREVADALSHAHGHDVLHRDIKPENILLESRHAVVADFGIARAISAAGGEGLTETGLAVGTPSCMSPEQAAGEKDLDGRSDLYSLGCLFFEMLAGQPPFTGPTVETVIQQWTVASRYTLAYALGRGDFDRADALCDSVLAEAGSPASVADGRSFCGSLSAARGRVRQAIGRTEAARPSYGEQRRLLDYSNVVLGVALAEHMRERPAAARAQLEAALDRFSPDSVRGFERVVYRTTLGVGAALLGHTDLLDRFAETFPEPSGAVAWTVDYAEAMMSAARSLARGEAEAAVASLREIDALGYVLSGWLPHAELMYGLAFEELAELDSAVAHFERAIRPRVMVESGSWGFARMQFPFVLRSLAELETARGDTTAAIERYRQFLDLWNDADPELQPTVRDVKQLLAELVTER